MTDIATFIWARLAEERETAQAACRRSTMRPGHKGQTARWTSYLEGGDAGYAIESNDGNISFTVGRENVAVHIARHDPAAVLRWVEALDQIVDDCARQAEDGSTSGAELGKWTLRYLASIWAGAEGWDPAWEVK